MIVQARDLVKRYGAVHALNGLSFAVDEGNAFALIGSNGAGTAKSGLSAADLRAGQVGRSDLSVGARPTQSLGRREVEGSSIALPVIVAGLPPNTILWSDRADVRLIGADGGLLFRGVGDLLQVCGGTDAAGAQQTVRIAPEIYQLHMGRELRLKVDYSFALLAEELQTLVPAAGGEAMLSGATRCSTRPARDGAPHVLLRCLTVGRVPSCFTVALATDSEVRREFEDVACDPDYAPYRRSTNLFSVFGIDVPLSGTRSGSNRDDGGDHRDWVIRLVTYEARAHFKRRLVVHPLRLAEWAPGGAQQPGLD